MLINAFSYSEYLKVRLFRFVALLVIIIGLAGNKCSPGKRKVMRAADAPDEASSYIEKTTAWMTKKGLKAAKEAGKVFLTSEGIYRHDNGSGWDPDDPNRIYLPGCWNQRGEFKCQPIFPEGYLPPSPGIEMAKKAQRMAEEEEEWKWWSWWFE